MKCIRCGRPLLREPAAVMSTRRGVSAWGPQCAIASGLIPAPKRRNTSAAAVRAPSKARARSTVGQADWIDNLNTTPETTGQEGQNQ